MKKFKYIFISLLIVTVSISSCSDGDVTVPPVPTLEGEWHTFNRTFKSDDKKLEERINSLLREDLRVYDIVKIYKEVEIGIGTISEASYKKNSSDPQEDRLNPGTFEVNTRQDTIKLDMQRGGQIVARMTLNAASLITEIDANKAYIDFITSEIGGDVTLNPEGSKGTFTFVERKQTSLP